ncbi:hypothetical protein BR93DRAFT_264420 [Coniochaeta sp. PMI_546]|nr:hypothetical protein BR93DRAFT_264420 [Coniochaeta sp. PMI_546]
MKAVLFPLAFLAAAVSAQSTACAADYIVEACLGTTNGQLAACSNNDYGCQCTAYTNILTCFNNCPNDTRISTYQSQKQIFCAMASHRCRCRCALIYVPKSGRSLQLNGKISAAHYAITARFGLGVIEYHGVDGYKLRNGFGEWAFCRKRTYLSSV